MKAYIIQPRYSMNSEEMEACFLEELALLDSCDNAADIIVLPEYSDVLAVTKTNEEFICAMDKYGPIIAQKAKETGDIEKFAKKALKVKSANIIANVALSSFLLAVGLPKLTFMLRKKVTGSDAEPGLIKNA